MRVVHSLTLTMILRVPRFPSRPAALRSARAGADRPPWRGWPPRRAFPFARAAEARWHFVRADGDEAEELAALLDLQRRAGDLGVGELAQGDRLLRLPLHLPRGETERTEHGA